MGKENLVQHGRASSGETLTLSGIDKVSIFFPKEQVFRKKMSLIDFLTQIDIHLTNNVQNMVTSRKYAKLVQSCI